MCAGVAGYVATQLPQWEQQMLDDINEIRADRYMPPIVSTPAFGVGLPVTKEETES